MEIYRRFYLFLYTMQLKVFENLIVSIAIKSKLMDITYHWKILMLRLSDICCLHVNTTNTLIFVYVSLKLSKCCCFKDSRNYMFLYRCKLEMRFIICIPTYLLDHIKVAGLMRVCESQFLPQGYLRPYL